MLVLPLVRTHRPVGGWRKRRARWPKNARAPRGVPLGPGALVDVPTIHNRMDFADARFAVPAIESSRGRSDAERKNG